MSTMVESLKRLYDAKCVSLLKLDTMIQENKIIQEEYNYIISQ